MISLTVWLAYVPVVHAQKKEPCPREATRNRAGVCVCPRDQKLVSGPRGLLCVPVNCLPGQFRGSDQRCHCPTGKTILEGAKGCVPRLCAEDQVRDENMNCAPRCRGNVRWSPKSKQCVPRRCPAPLLRDPHQETCVERCPKGYAPDDKRVCVGSGPCPRGATRNASGDCVCKEGFEIREGQCQLKDCGEEAFLASDLKCYPCEAGHYRPAGKLVCEPRQCDSQKRWNPATKRCDWIPCPAGMARPVDKEYCVELECPAGTQRNNVSQKCEPITCSGPVRLSADKKRCVLRVCPKGVPRNPQTDECQFPPCPAGQIRPLGQFNCVPVQCPEGASRDATGQCVCSVNMRMNSKNTRCVPVSCPVNQDRDAEERCNACPDGTIRPAHAPACVPSDCPAGARRDAKTHACLCPKGTSPGPDGRHCAPASCPEGHEKHPQTGLCQCLKGHFKPDKLEYCVPSDCGTTAFRDKEMRCSPCPDGRYRPAGSDVCVWRPCPRGQNRTADGRCQGALECADHERLSSDETRCVPKLCPSGARRDPISETCITVEETKPPPVRKACRPGFHANEKGECVHDTCPRGQVRDPDGKCARGSCPAGFKRLPDGACVHIKCPANTTRDTKTQSCLPNIRSCPEGTFLNPQGRCVPAPCPAGHGRPTDRLEQCLPFHKDWKKPCPGKEVRDREGKCRMPRKLKCPPGSRLVAIRCYYGI